MTGCATAVESLEQRSDCEKLLRTAFFPDCRWIAATGHTGSSTHKNENGKPPRQDLFGIGDVKAKIRRHRPATSQDSQCHNPGGFRVGVVCGAEPTKRIIHDGTKGQTGCRDDDYNNNNRLSILLLIFQFCKQ